MKISKKQLIVRLSFVAVFAVALLMMILDFVTLDTIASHPLWLFAFIMLAGFGLIELILGAINKSPFSFMLSSFLLTGALTYSFIDFLNLIWYIVVLSAVFLFVIIASLSFIVAGNKTEDIALNKSPDYKNYEERKAEKLEKEAKEEPKELPKIKSFKD